MMFEDQIVPDAPGAPVVWQVQTKVVENFVMNQETKFLESLPHAEIHEIIRIQSKWIWQQYVFKRRRLHDKNKGAINEMELFHGSREAEPLSICNGMDGFDMRHSRGGRWGSAILHPLRNMLTGFHVLLMVSRNDYCYGCTW